MGSVFGTSAGSDLESFEIAYGRDRIDDLHRRIDETIWPEITFETGWSTGTNDKVLRDLVRYWRNEYDWFSVQEDLNRLDHFRTFIEDGQMHFVRYAGTGERRPFPVLLLHGWPNSFVEFMDAARLLANGIEGRPGFELIVPSLPGFVFSEAPRNFGAHPGHLADRMHQLMMKLGFEHYGVAGLDWGAEIAKQLAHRYPDHMVGLHLPGLPGWQPPAEGKPLSDEERAFLAERERFNQQEWGYSSIQGTKPQTLAYALQDSPVGLLAWVLEKYWGWSDHSGDLWETFDRDDILTTVMLYWLPRRVLSAARIYYEFGNWPEEEKRSGSIEVPTSFARWPKNPWTAPRSLMKEEGFTQLFAVTEQPRGGHFPAMEQPELYASDVAAFFDNF